MTARRRHLLRVCGVVQGVGFRPFVYATATELALSGLVGNDSAGVFIEVEGEPSALEVFASRVMHQPPPLAVVESVDVRAVPLRGGTGFHIAATPHGAPGRTLASPDMATCADCLRELRDPTDRRYRHPFITCTNCGPRFTIITELPYDRCSTTMSSFAMCARCAAEYHDPADRRFHAQPIACPACGPTVAFLQGTRTVAGDDAIGAARDLLAAGSVVAVKGLGGFHLACDARNNDAVRVLRERKRRGDKPFAVMVRDLRTARRLAQVSEQEAQLLASPQRPILLLTQGGEPLAPAVAPGNRDLGVLLAYTPVHELLLGLDGDRTGPDVLVMTSGNLGGEPIAYRNEDAVRRLAGLADGFLLHDREIRVPCDDSVLRVVAGQEVPMRRSRGYAPLPVALPFEVPATLAVGADLKNTCCVGEGRYGWLSQHIGDMDDLATLQAFTATEAHLEALTKVAPQLLVADAHPDYRSTAWAREHAAGRPVKEVQHHHAHIAAVMGENGLRPDRQVIGCAFDGTGYGPDGAVWGGEVLIADYKGFQRFARLAYVPLAGGDLSVQRPYRMALAHLWAAGIAWEQDLPPVAACPPRERAVLQHQLHTGFGCAPTSSMGRLFDAVAALLGVRQVVDFEAQAAIELEALARGHHAPGGAFDIGAGAGGALVADPAPLLRHLVDGLRAGEPVAVLAGAFHHACAELVRTLADRARSATGLDTVALSGGVFQNPTLLAAATQALRADGFSVLTHRRLPPNDGGMALGQLLVGSTT